MTSSRLAIVLGLAVVGATAVALLLHRGSGTPMVKGGVLPVVSLPSVSRQPDRALPKAPGTAPAAADLSEVIRATPSTELAATSAELEAQRAASRPAVRVARAAVLPPRSALAPAIVSAVPGRPSGASQLESGVLVTNFGGRR